MKRFFIIIACLIFIASLYMLKLKCDIKILIENSEQLVAESKNALKSGENDKQEDKLLENIASEQIFESIIVGNESKSENEVKELSVPGRALHNKLLQGLNPLRKFRELY